MDKMDLIKFLRNYQPYDEFEEVDRQAVLQLVEAFGDEAYRRENLVGHISSSCWIVNKANDKVLMCFHNIYQDWSWLGGHADGDKDLLNVALKEAAEESGLKNLRVVSQEPIDVCVCNVGHHIKRGKAVSRHCHYNLTYLLEADENEPLKMRPEENSVLKWIEFDQVLNECKGLRNIYERIIKKIKSGIYK